MSSAKENMLEDVEESRPFIFILIYLCRVEYAAKEADIYTALPKPKLDNLIKVIKRRNYTKNYIQ